MKINTIAIHKGTKKSSISASLMLCGLLGCAATLQSATPAVPLPPGQLLIPANGKCLYTAIIMGYLLPVRQDTDKLTTRIDQLFGYQPADYLNPLDQALQNPKDYLSYLYSKEFKVLVNAFMSRMQLKEGTWGGPQELQTMATKLKVNIQAYYPDPSNRTHLVQSDLTQPTQANADITLHIVRDRVHPAEVLTQAEKESATDNPHYQHYRLKYTLSHSTASTMHVDDHIVDSTTSKKASTAARSADSAGFSAPTWQNTGQGARLAGVQQVSFTPAAPPLIIPKGTTHTLPAQAILYEFSYIKIAENATLTIVPWQPNQQSGGKLSIHCYGDCILSKNAKISVSAKGYSGSMSPHYYGYGPRGGASGIYCAAGGSHSTAGGSGQCRHAFDQATTYHASSQAPAGQVILTRDRLICGSGGGYLQYSNSSESPLSPGADGASGGGALYLEIHGNLQLAENTAFLANGGEATPLTGGAGSGGSICLALKGAVTFTSSTAQLSVNAQGGNNQKALHPTAQGAGGDGHITLYMHPQNQHALKRVVTQPPALVLRSPQVAQRKMYRDDLGHYLMEKSISVATINCFWQWLEAEEMEEDAIMEDMEAATPSQSNIYQFDKAIFHALQHLMTTLAPQHLPKASAATPALSVPTTIPHHVTIATKYYNAQGVAHAEKADYPQAMLYHQASLALQMDKYGDQPHPDKADTLLYQAKLAAHQGHYAQAMEAAKAALYMRQTLYQAKAPAHAAIIEACNWLGWLDYQQGRPRQALQRLEDTLQLWRQQTHSHQQALLLADTYSYIGLGQQSLGQYQQAIDKYHSGAQAMVQMDTGVDHSLRHPPLHYIGQAHTQLGQYAQATAPHHDEKRLLADLSGQAPPHPHKAPSLCGEALTYLKLWRKKPHEDQQELCLVDTYNYIGLVQQSLGQYQQAIDKYHSEAQAMVKSTSGVHHSLRATTLHYIGQAHTQLGQYAQAIATHHEEMRLLAELHGQDTPHPDKARSLRGEALAYLKQGNAAVAMQKYRTSLAQLQKTYGQKAAHPDMAAALSGIAHAHAAQGSYPLATLLHEKSQAMLQAMYGQQAHHPALADKLEDLGDLALQQQATGQTMQHYQRAHKMKIALYSEKEAHVAIALSHANIGRAHLEAHQPEKALAAQEKALAIATAVYGEVADMPIIGRLQREIGLVYLALHDDDNAQKALQISLHTYTHLFGDQPHPDTAHTHYALGKRYLAQSRYKQALDHTSKALHIWQAIYQKVAHHPTITAALLQLGRIHATQAQYDRAIHCYALATRCQVHHLLAVSDLGQHLAHFVPPNASLQKTLAQKEQPLPLHAKSIVPFLHQSPAQVLLLDGDAGAGKSLYGRFLEKTLWEACPSTLEDMQTQAYTIPLFISLAALQDPTQKAISQALQQYGWDKATIAYFKEKLTKKSISKPNHIDDDDHKDGAKDNELAAPVPMVVDASCVIILDGYDEINNLEKPLNIYTAYQLDTWHAKVLVTCRTEHLASLPNHARYLTPDGKGLQKRYMRPFDAQQIDHYLDKIVQIVPASADANASDAHHSDTTAFDRYKAHHWTKADYQKAFNQIPRLQELIKSPLLLRMLTTILPQWQSKAHPTLTRTAVYRAFTHQWIEKALTRMHITGTAAKQKAAAAKAYAAALGFALVLEEEQVFCRGSEDKAWQCFLAGEDALTYLAILPLRKVGAHQYQFIHKSCQEFFAAQHIYDSLQQLHTEQKDLQAHFAQQVKPYQRSDRTAALQDPQTYRQYATSCPPINQKLLKTAPAIIAFLQDGFVGQQAANFQKWLFQVIKASTHNPKVAIAASNAITFLAGCVPLGGQVWPHIQVPDAVLDRAFLAYTNLQGANLQRVSLREAYLEGVQCQQTQVSGLQLGAYPYFAHESAVNSVSWSHDDLFLASASSDNSVRIWDAKTGEQVQICRGHDKTVMSVSWSHDDRLLASASYDKSVRIWDAKTGEEVQIYTGHDKSVLSVCWSHDDRFLASASYDKRVLVWDAKTGEEVQICRGHDKTVMSVRWSHDDRFLASASADKSVRVWDAKTGEQVQICTGHDNSVNSVSWSHDDRFLASASEDKSVRVWDAKTGEQVQICTKHNNYVMSVSWSHDDCFLASAGHDHSVRIWEAKTGGQVQICRAHDKIVMSVSWSHDGRFLASASEDKSVRIREAKTDGQVQICTAHTGYVRSVSWSHDDRFLASASADRSVRVWDAKTGAQVQICMGHAHWVRGVGWSHDDCFLASASYDKRVRIWDAKTGAQVQICTGHKSAVWSVSWSHDDLFLASASEDKSVRIWEAKTGRQVRICRGHKKAVWSVSWSHDDCFLASASWDKTVRIWDAKSGQQVQVCTGHAAYVTSVSWSHDDFFLASASYDNSVRVWDAKRGQQVKICRGHTNWVRSVSWSHDDLFLASASIDNSVRVWDAKTGSQVQICTGHDNAVNSVSWSHDDRFLASASHDKSVRIWDRQPDGQVQMSTGHDVPVAWLDHDQHLAAQSDDKSVHSSEQATGKGTLPEQCRPVLVIGSWNGLVLRGADFSGAVGLLVRDKNLIRQKGGLVEKLSKSA